jgi:hypothetical protein
MYTEQEAEARTTEIERLHRVLARTAIARWRSNAIGKAWSNWWEEVRQNHIMVNMARRWKHALVRRSWMAWKWMILQTTEANTSEIERLKRVLARAAIARWRKKTVGKAWSKWWEEVRQNRRLKHLTSRALSMWRNRVSVYAL